MVEPLPPAFRAGGFDCGEPDLTLDALKRDKLVAWYARYGFLRNGGHEKGLAKLRSLASRNELTHVSMRFDILLARELLDGVPPDHLPEGNRT